MGRRMAGILAAAALLIGLGIPARGAENAGTLQVQLKYAEGETAEVALYYVAQPRSGDYVLMDLYGGGVIRREDADSPDLALWLSERTGEEGDSITLSKNGSGSISGLKEGLYLLRTRTTEGDQYAQPLLIPMPMDGQWTIQVYPQSYLLLTKSPNTGDHPTPLIGAMGLVLSGLGLYFCGEKLRKTLWKPGKKTSRKGKRAEKHIDKTASGGYNT